MAKLIDLRTGEVVGDQYTDTHGAGDIASEPSVEVLYDREEDPNSHLGRNISIAAIGAVVVGSGILLFLGADNDQDINTSPVDKSPSEAVAAYLSSNPNEFYANPNGLEFVGVQSIVVATNQDIISVLYDEVEGMNNPGSLESIISLYEAYPELYTIIDARNIEEDGPGTEELLPQVYSLTGEIAAPDKIITAPKEQN